MRSQREAKDRDAISAKYDKPCHRIMNLFSHLKDCCQVTSCSDHCSTAFFSAVAHFLKERAMSTAVQRVVRV